MMLQLEKAEDFVVATGETHSVREFCEKAFAVVGIPIKWDGEGIDEVGINAKTNDVIIKIDERYFRPTGNLILHFIFYYFHFIYFKFIEI